MLHSYSEHGQTVWYIGKKYRHNLGISHSTLFCETSDCTDKFKMEQSAPEDNDENEIMEGKICDLCGAFLDADTFTIKSYHIWKFHMNKQMWKCNLCGEWSSNSPDIVIRLRHTALSVIYFQTNYSPKLITIFALWKLYNLESSLLIKHKLKHQTQLSSCRKLLAIFQTSNFRVKALFWRTLVTCPFQIFSSSHPNHEPNFTNNGEKLRKVFESKWIQAYADTNWNLKDKTKSENNEKSTDTSFSDSLPVENDVFEVVLKFFFCKYGSRPKNIEVFI